MHGSLGENLRRFLTEFTARSGKFQALFNEVHGSLGESQGFLKGIRDSPAGTLDVL